jgi:hypothetical protein
MDTAYDWITVIIFAGLIVLFLQRATSDRPDRENVSIFLYLGAGVGCAVANYLGNHGFPWLAIPLIIATLAYIYYLLKPFAPE